MNVVLVAVLVWLTVLFVWDLLLACWCRCWCGCLFCSWLLIDLVVDCGVAVLVFVVFCCS